MNVLALAPVSASLGLKSVIMTRKNAFQTSQATTQNYAGAQTSD